MTIIKHVTSGAVASASGNYEKAHFQVLRKQFKRDMRTGNVRLEQLNHGQIKIDTALTSYLASLSEKKTFYDNSRIYQLFEITGEGKISDVDLIKKINKQNSCSFDELQANIVFFIDECKKKQSPLYHPGSEVHVILDYVLIDGTVKVVFLEMEKNGEVHLHMRDLRLWKELTFGIS
jgi:hypothetical protein